MMVGLQLAVVVSVAAIASCGDLPPPRHVLKSELCRGRGEIDAAPLKQRQFVSRVCRPPNLNEPETEPLVFELEIIRVGRPDDLTASSILPFPF